MVGSLSVNNIYFVSMPDRGKLSCEGAELSRTRMTLEICWKKQIYSCFALDFKFSLKDKF